MTETIGLRRRGDSKVNLVPGGATNPLKPLKLRYSAKPTPQNGVEVARKWRRSDYRMPGTQTLVQIETGK